ncbi:MAG: hypothetical protein II877_08805 [Synergistaceae bacterium]|nr:hypothetical protein [Synergistaceae bacterium]
MTLSETLLELSVINRDNGRKFTDTSRLNAISEALSATKYSCINPGGLFHLYSPEPVSKIAQPVVIISSHVDCERSITKCFTEFLPGGLMRGTFDNSITNASLLHLMLEGRLPDNILAAFTGDEERNSRGAEQVMRFAKYSGLEVECVIVLDVTDMGWLEGADFTVENNFWSDSLGAKVIMSAENSGFKWCFVPENPYDIPRYVDMKYVLPFEAAEDESWEYDENDVQCFCLCIPVEGDMHSNEGVYARQESFMRYTDVVAQTASTISRRQ